jgi:endonuclease VIII-like 1
MPEITEVRIMSDFINQNSKDKTFTKVYEVQKGNIPKLYIEEEFTIEAISSGKELILNLKLKDRTIPIYVFMGMSGNWLYRETKTWEERRFTRLRLDDNSGMSLLLYGLYMGPRYRIGSKFTGTKRGPDPTKEFSDFKENVYKNLNKKDFDKPICEVLLNQEYFNGIGAYLTAEIVGRLDINPFRNIKSFSKGELNDLFDMILKCCKESYEFGGGELISWVNPISESRIDEWIKFYNKKDICYKQQFGKRNIWIQNKFKKSSF